MLAMVNMFGSHDWYKEGAEYLLAEQASAGSWHTKKTYSSAVVDTCFAILFLCKATTPIVNVPDEIITGRGILKEEDEK